MNPCLRRRSYRSAAALAIVAPSMALAQPADEVDAAAGLAGCFALEVGQWTVEWDPGRLPSRLELLSDPDGDPPGPGLAEGTAGSRSELRGARAVDERGDALRGFDRWTSVGPGSFTLYGGPHARVDLLFEQREGEGYRGFAVPRRPEMDASRSGRRPRAPVAARPVPCDR